ncbi:OLC1v1031138C1 [Oldenlandia corymbosa var. corymbosa]|uniref:OLC1v1031138C1 n=1 Tax=Oldenlandia corymbosa var. corymbosa TaxID=529605 RepID=A0AAV1CIK3_OLDCO|nr:OLC1v1031138C1 [Oldenlandia corymbosa var. corymbosa]
MVEIKENVEVSIDLDLLEANYLRSWIRRAFKFKRNEDVTMNTVRQPCERVITHKVDDGVVLIKDLAEKGLIQSVSVIGFGLVNPRLWHMACKQCFRPVHHEYMYKFTCWICGLEKLTRPR